jgi:mRNA interferase RelE/StbE
MKRYELLYTPAAAKMIRKMSPEIRELCKNALEHIAANPYSGKRLKGPLAEYRSFRTNEYRIVYTVEEKRITVIVVAVGHRRDIYEKILRMLKNK